ncbi:hypothetical protein QFZ79_003729 [Arthrobacter sp. V4I6]|nr:hypothetical protein [Arthrobacter sp. V1I7]MDQ0855618.1 hypothetical protein [Arthrobacter sp. V4I6]
MLRPRSSTMASQQSQTGHLEIRSDDVIGISIVAKSNSEEPADNRATKPVDRQYW